METIQSTVLEFKIPADIRYISMVRRGVRNLAESVGFEREAISDMEVAVSEAVTNSVEHGSPNSIAAAVVVKCIASLEEVIVEIEDEGVSEYTSPISDFSDPANERGRGVMMMRTLMDECEGVRTESGNRVRMAKQK